MCYRTSGFNGSDKHQQDMAASSKKDYSSHGATAMASPPTFVAEVKTRNTRTLKLNHTETEEDEDEEDVQRSTGARPKQSASLAAAGASASKANGGKKLVKKRSTKSPMPFRAIENDDARDEGSNEDEDDLHRDAMDTYYAVRMSAENGRMKNEGNEINFEVENVFLHLTNVVLLSRQIPMHPKEKIWT